MIDFYKTHLLVTKLKRYSLTYNSYAHTHIHIKTPRMFYKIKQHVKSYTKHKWYDVL